MGVTFKEELDSEYTGIAANETLSNIYLDESGLPYEVGDVIKNPDLAKTLQLIADGGKDAFYTGDMAQAMVDAVAAWGGNMTMEDLANYEVRFVSLSLVTIKITPSTLYHRHPPAVHTWLRS